MTAGKEEQAGVSQTVRQLAWFVALWLAGVVSLGIVALAIRWAIGG
jgi:hypothetical protein